MYSPFQDVEAMSVIHAIRALTSWGFLFCYLALS